MLPHQFECAESRGDVSFPRKRMIRAHTPPLNYDGCIMAFHGATFDEISNVELDR